MIEVIEEVQWMEIGPISEFPIDGGVCMKVGVKQIAIFNFSSTGKWYATDNMCPHKMQMVLSRGIIGDLNGEPKIACAFHKKQFSLESGKCLDDGNCKSIATYPIKIEGSKVYVGV